MTDISQGSDNTLPPAPPPVTEEDIKAAMALAPTLDPSIAESIYAGNTAIIAAIKLGANTDDDIAERLINMGLTTGFPPGIQQIIDQQLNEMNAQRDAENSRLLAAGGAVLAAGFEPSGERWSVDVPGQVSGSSEWSNSDYWRNLGFSDELAGQMAQAANENAYYGQQYEKGVAEYQKMKEDAEKILQEAGLDPNDKKALQEKREELEKIPENERTEEQNRLLQALNDQNAATLALANYEKEQAARNEQLSLMERMKKDEAFRKEIEEEAKRKTEEARAEALKANPNMTPEELDKVKVSVNDVLLQRARDRVKDNANAMEHAETAERKNDIAADTDRNKLDAAKIATSAQQADLNAARLDEQSVGRNQDAKIVSAANKPQAADEFSDDAAPAAVAQAPAAPRLTINALPLAAAGLDKLGAAPELVANDTAPATPERKPEAPRAAQTSAPGSMGV